jgi:cation transport ATPase
MTFVIAAGPASAVLFGVGGLWMAVLADVGTSLLVTLNGMRLLRRPRPEAGRPQKKRARLR